jgi:predicted ATPase/DNA-binding winged helix-turn-helix (wHTH) protein
LLVSGQSPTRLPLPDRGPARLKEFASFRLDTSKECLWREGEEIALPPKPFAVLRYLVENPGRLITHDELLDALWPETYVQPQVLRTYMLELRRILGDDTAQPRFIQTMPKRGYRFIAPVKEWQGANGAGTPGTAGGLAGRSEEMARLEGELRHVEQGQRRVVFVTGEPGIGKTALADAFCAQVSRAQPAMVARGQCVEGFAANEPYYPVMEALRQLCAPAGGEAASRVLARVAAPWLSALGRDEAAAGARALEAGDAERTAGQLCAALEEMSAEQPLILVFEDLQWADDATLHLISALARRRARCQMLVLMTCGSAEGTPRAGCRGLKQDLLMRQLAAELALTPLTQVAVSQLLRRELRQETLPAGLSAFVHQHSEGNPLFAKAMVEHLIGQGFLVRERAEGAPGGWTAAAPFAEIEGSVPEGLAQMIELEMERLRPEEQRLLEAGSLVGIAFPVWAVAAALDEEMAATEEACAALARRLSFVERAGEDELPDGTRSDFYVFVHSMYRQVLYRRQPATRRARRHQRIAIRLGELFAGREASVARERALHFEAAGDRLSAAMALRSAARHAQQRNAQAEAAELLEHALRLAENLGELERDAATRAIREELAAAEMRDDDASRVKVS